MTQFIEGFQNGATLSGAFGTPTRPENVEVPFVANRAPTPNDVVGYPTGKHWLQYGDSEWVLVNQTTFNGLLQSNWKRMGSGELVGFNVPLGVTPIIPNPLGIVNFTSTGGTIDITGLSASPNNNTINLDLTGGPIAPDLHVAKWIVNPAGSSAGANKTTITLAMAAASAGDTIFLMPAVYTENFVWKAGVNITAFDCDGYNPNVKSIGKITCTDDGSRSMSGICLQTNADNFLEITGTLATGVILNSCNLQCTNHTGMLLSSSGTGAGLSLVDCFGDIKTTGITYYAISSSFAVQFQNTFLSNTGLSSTPSTIAGTASLGIFGGYNTYPIVTSDTGQFAFVDSFFDTSATNTISIIHGGGSFGENGLINGCNIVSGSASCVSVSAGSLLFMSLNTLNTTNTNAIVGAGLLAYSGNTFNNGGHGNAVANRSPRFIEGGYYQGLTTGAVILAGGIGEEIRSVVPAAGNVPLVSNTGKTITSIVLTPGIWDISAIIQIAANGTTSTTTFAGGISLVDNSTAGLVLGDSGSSVDYTSGAAVGYGATLSVPSYRVTIAVNTTYYLVALAVFTVSTAVAYGRISANRCG